MKLTGILLTIFLALNPIKSLNAQDIISTQFESANLLPGEPQRMLDYNFAARLGLYIMKRNCKIIKKPQEEIYLSLIPSTTEKKQVFINRYLELRKVPKNAIVMGFKNIKPYTIGGEDQIQVVDLDTNNFSPLGFYSLDDIYKDAQIQEKVKKMFNYTFDNEDLTTLEARCAAFREMKLKI